jgi:hypothetical protein
MTRIRGSVTALAVGLLLAGCGPDKPAASGADSAAASTKAEAGANTTARPSGEAAGQDNTGSGGRWCDAAEAFTAATDRMLTKGSGKAEIDKARARLKDLKAAAPAEIKTQVLTISEFYAAVIDTTGKSMVEAPEAYARVGKTAQKLSTAMPPVSDYTLKHCPGLDKPLPSEMS